MRCEYMIDGQVTITYAHSIGNPLRSDTIRLSRSAISADEELELAFRDFGEFQRFVKFCHEKMWAQINVMQTARAKKRGTKKR